MQSATIATGIVTYWAAKAMKPQVPGGLWFGPVPDEAKIPYARLGVQEGDQERASDGSYIQSPTVQIDIYGNLGPEAMGDIARQVDFIFKPGNFASLTFAQDRVNTYRCMGIYEVPAALEVDPGRKDAKEMVKLQRAYLLQIQASPI